MKHSDTISRVCKIFEDILEFHITYNLTRYCTKCHPIGVTRKEIAPLLLTYDYDELYKSDSIDSLIRSIFNYNDSKCSKCDYNEDGVSLNINTSSIITIITNFKLPQFLFFVEAINFSTLKKSINFVNKLFKNEIIILGEIYQIIGIVFMPIPNHFSAEIFNYEGDDLNLAIGKDYYYDGMKEDGRIIEVDEKLSSNLNSEIKHLFIYSKK